MLAYVGYLGRFFCPMNLAIAYPHRDVHLPLPVWQVLGAAAFLLGTTAAVIAVRRRCPYLAVGWLWYLGMMLPTIGLLHMGTEAEPDRFSYLPQIGIGIALAWAAAEEKGDWLHLPGRPVGCSAQMVPVPFSRNPAWPIRHRLRPGRGRHVAGVGGLRRGGRHPTGATARRCGDARCVARRETRSPTVSSAWPWAPWDKPAGPSTSSGSR